MVEDALDGQSGSDETARREGLRQALYRPGVTSVDYERFSEVSSRSAPQDQQSVSEDGPGESFAATAQRGRRSKRLMVAVAASALVVACVGVGLTMAADRGDPIRGSASVPAAADQQAVDSTRSEHLVAQDAGTQSFATGSASTLADGRFLYTVRSGDTVLGIASRFQVCTADVVGGYPLAAQGRQLTAGLAITVELGPWPVGEDGTVDCVSD